MTSRFARLPSWGGDRASVLQSPKGSYKLGEHPYRTGDFSEIYRAIALDAGKIQALVKIAHHPTSNPLLENEARLLGRFANESGLATMRRFVPDLIDTFLVVGEKNSRYRTTVFAEQGGFVSLAQIIAAYPHGLDPRDAAWIWRRVLGHTLTASAAGVVHSAIVPDHVLVHPISHNPLYLGWAHAIPDPRSTGQRVTLLIDRYRDWYPPEVFDKETPTHQTDLYMAGMTMVKLLGGDTGRRILPTHIPDDMRRIVLRCIEKAPARRPADGKQVLDEFTRVVRNRWGRVYRPLTMPVQ